MPEESEEVVRLDAVRLADVGAAQRNVAAAQFAVQGALQVHQLLVARFSALADGFQCGVVFDDLQDAALDALAVLLDENLLSALAQGDVAAAGNKVRQVDGPEVVGPAAAVLHGRGQVADYLRSCAA